MHRLQDRSEKAVALQPASSGPAIAAAVAMRCRVTGAVVTTGRVEDVKEKNMDIDLVVRIYFAYTHALKRLPPAVAAALVRGDLGVAICVGFMNPTYNFVANATFTAYGRELGDDGGEAEDEEAVKAAATEAAFRSIDAMKAFLTGFFPWLEELDAKYYLYLANGDPLAAARLVAEYREMKGLWFANVETALRCAALAVKHPDPGLLVDGWVTQARLLHRQGYFLSYPDDCELAIVWPPPSPGKEELYLPPPPLQYCMHLPWDRAASRCLLRTHADLAPPQCERALRRALLGKIHGIYLQALARLPGFELRGRYHRSVIKAGNCYGPMESASNVILNTVWYDAAFPATREVADVDMVPVRCLHRAEARSLRGLVAFLRAGHRGLTEYDAVRCLVVADADERRAAEEAERLGYHAVPAAAAANPEAYYKAAAVAARHPRPAAQAKLLASYTPRKLLFGRRWTEPPAVTLLHRLSFIPRPDLLQLVRLLSPKSSAPRRPGFSCMSSLLPQPRRRPLKPASSPATAVSSSEKVFWQQHERVSKVARRALRRYAEEDGNDYELHSICGANERVREQSSRRPCWWHINFLAARRRDEQPTLFFAEYGDDGDDNGAVLRCCSVPCWEAEPAVRCIYCEKEGLRIVHPYNPWEFVAGDLDKMVRGETPYTCDGIISLSNIADDFDGELEEDAIYNGGGRRHRKSKHK